jgi:hypothetical protein
MLGELLSGSGAVIAALAAWRVKQVGKEVKSPNGTRAGQLIYDTNKELMKHINDSDRHV